MDAFNLAISKFSTKRGVRLESPWILLDQQFRDRARVKSCCNKKVIFLLFGDLFEHEIELSS